MTKAIMFTAFTHVAIMTALIGLAIHRGCFEAVTVEIGDEFYAEKSPRWKIFPETITMPLNTFVNYGYVIVGSIWLAKTCNHADERLIDSRMEYIFHVFNWMSIFYGPIQCLRILIQSHEFAVFDQIYTLPFFMWTLVWTIYVNSDYWNRKLVMFLMGVSLLSYCLSLVFSDGFDWMLGVHIAVATVCAAITLLKHWSRSSLCYFLCLFASMWCFVVLKLLDLHLPNIHPIFTVVSGHFVSKIADFMQIHFTNEFVFSMINRRQITKVNTEQMKKTQ